MLLNLGMHKIIGLYSKYVNVRGVYSDAIDYVENDLVEFNGSAYFCTEPTTQGQSPGTNPEKWALFVSKGNKGDKGDKGEPGPPGMSYSYEHVQIMPSTVWTVSHNMSKYPGVTIVDSAGTKVIGDIQYVDQNTCLLQFTTAFSGKAYLT